MAYGYELRRRRRRPIRIDDLENFLENLRRRIELTELELIRYLPLEELAKVLIARGYPLIYYRREMRIYTRKEEKGILFRRPVEERTKEIREVYLASRGWV
jgi:hypothetical protein